MMPTTLIGWMPIIAAVLASFAVMVAVIYGFTSWQRTRLAAQARQAIIRAGGSAAVARIDAEEKKQKKESNSLNQLIQMGRIIEKIPGLSAVVNGLTEAGLNEPRSRTNIILGTANLPRMLDNAGLSGKGVTPRDVVTAKLGGMLLTLVIALVFGIYPTSVSKILIFLFVLYMGFYMPTYLLKEEITKRATKIRNALSRAADVIAMSVSAGIPIEKAVREYCDLFQNALSEEFERTLDEINVGRSSRDAWISTAERNTGAVDDLARLANSIAQALTMGTPLEATLRGQARELRTRRRQLFQAAAARAPIKMMIPLVFLLLPSLMVVLLGPIAAKFIGG